jgi:hypothetical protein
MFLINKSFKIDNKEEYYHGAVQKEGIAIIPFFQREVGVVGIM